MDGNGRQVSKHFAAGVENPLLVGVLLQALDVLSSNFMVVDIICSRDLLQVVACWCCSIGIVFCLSSRDIPGLTLASIYDLVDRLLIG